jgi:hypothetical protein
MSYLTYQAGNDMETEIDINAAGTTATCYDTITAPKTVKIYREEGTGDNRTDVLWFTISLAASSSSDSGNTGSGSSSAPKLTIVRSGDGVSNVNANGNPVNSGSQLQPGTEVSISITPAAGKVPNALLNGYTVTLTANSGIYSGSFQMPNTNANLVINSGSTSGGSDMN